MPDTDRYNGWPNWATWNVAVWFDNDEGLYMARGAAEPCGGWTPEDARRHVLSAMPFGTPDMDSFLDLADVDWKEIAEAWNEG